MNEEQRNRFEALITELQGDTSRRQLADRLKIPSGTVASWHKGVGAKSKLAIVTYISEWFAPRTLDDLEEYLRGEITLEDFLDPQHGLNEMMTSLTLQVVRAWIKNRANLRDKTILLQDLVDQVSGIAIENSSERLSRSLQTLLDGDDPQVNTLEAIARMTGIKLKRLEALYRGEALPCEDEILALSPYLPEDIAELRRIYVTGGL